MPDKTWEQLWLRDQVSGLIPSQSKSQSVPDAVSSGGNVLKLLVKVGKMAVNG